MSQPQSLSLKLPCTKFSSLLLYSLSLYTGPSTTIYWVDARHPGSVNDNFILRNSSLYAKYNRGELPFEGAKVLGDMGYESFCPWLITPFPGKYISITSYHSILPVTHTWKKFFKANLDNHTNKILKL